MIGIDFGGMIRDAILLNAVLAAGILCTITAIAMFATKRKWAFRIALTLAVLFCGFIGGYVLWTRPSTPKTYDIEFVIDSDWVYSKTTPGEKTYEYGNNMINHKVWGILNVDITLPDGKSIKGRCSQIDVFTKDSEISSITLSYRPSETLSAVDYWQQGGIYSCATLPRHTLIDRGTYTVEIHDRVAGEISLNLNHPPSERIAVYRILRSNKQK